MLKIARDFILISGATAAALFLASFLNISQAPAHSWYDPSCCHSMDCAPVTAQRRDDNAQGVWMTSRHGSVFVPDEFKRRYESRDHERHICMRNSSPLGTGIMKPICVYDPPGV